MNVAFGTHVKWWYLEQFFFSFKILIIQVFQSSSINAKKKFWGVPHLVCVIFIFNVISFISVQGSVKIKLACSKALLLTIPSSNIMTHSNGDKYFFFYKSWCGKCSPETKQFTNRVEIQYRKIIFITPSNISDGFFWWKDLYP